MLHISPLIQTSLCHCFCRRLFQGHNLWHIYVYCLWCPQHSKQSSCLCPCDIVIVQLAFLDLVPCWNTLFCLVWVNSFSNHSLFHSFKLVWIFYDFLTLLYFVCVLCFDLVYPLPILYTTYPLTPSTLFYCTDLNSSNQTSTYWSVTLQANNAFSSNISIAIWGNQWNSCIGFKTKPCTGSQFSHTLWMMC